MRVAHLVPAFAVSRRDAGNWKACESVGRLLAEAGHDVERVVFEEETGADIPDAVLAKVRHAIVEYTRFADLPARLKRRCPALRLHVRAHNAEAFQHLAQTGPPFYRPRTVYGFFRLLARDARCARPCESLLSISDWDAVHYWRWIAGARRTAWLPYVSPWPDLRPGEAPLPWEARQPVIVSMAGSYGRIGGAGLDRLALVARRCPAGGGWRFATSGGLFPGGPALPPEIELLRDLDHPWPLLCRVRVLAALSPFGYGFKTTVLDALSAGCHVLIHPAQYRQLPTALRPQVVALDPCRPFSWDDLSARLTCPPDPLATVVNGQMREIALRQLQRVLTG